MERRANRDQALGERIYAWAKRLREGGYPQASRSGSAGGSWSGSCSLTLAGSDWTWPRPPRTGGAPGSRHPLPQPPGV